MFGLILERIEISDWPCLSVFLLWQDFHLDGSQSIVLNMSQLRDDSF